METVTINIYTIKELTDERAKERARDWYRNGMEYHWLDESLDSIKAFCEQFGVTLKAWEVGAYLSPYFSTDAENSHFRGLKVSQFKPDHMPTGYCLDWPLWSTFFHEFKRTGNAKAAFVEALHEGFKCWCADLEDQNSDEYIDEHLEANGYTFNKDGKRFNA
jgi:hypothetical protein